MVMLTAVTFLMKKIVPIKRSKKQNVIQMNNFNAKTILVYHSSSNVMALLTALMVVMRINAHYPHVNLMRKNAKMAGNVFQKHIGK